MITRLYKHIFFVVLFIITYLFYIFPFEILNKFLFNPWETPQEILDKANVQLGKNYPKPIVDLKTSRQEALSAFAELKVSQ